MSVRIFAVSEGSPAEKAGIGAEDRIISINGEAITDELTIRRCLPSPGLKLNISILMRSVKSLSVKKNGNPSDLGLTKEKR